MPKTEAKLEDYKVLATIGTGNFGVCRKVKRKSDRKVKDNYLDPPTFERGFCNMNLAHFIGICVERNRLWRNE